MATTRPATAKQEALILSLARQLDGGAYRYILDAAHLLPISRSAARGLTNTDASLCIDHLQAELAEKQRQADAAELAPAPVAATPAPVTGEGGPDPATLLGMLGKTVTITWVNKAGETVEWTGHLRSLTPSDHDGTPELDLTTKAGTRSVRAHRLASWTVS